MDITQEIRDVFEKNYAQRSAGNSKFTEEGLNDFRRSLFHRLSTKPEDYMGVMVQSAWLSFKDGLELGVRLEPAITAQIDH